MAGCGEIGLDIVAVSAWTYNTYSSSSVPVPRGTRACFKAAHAVPMMGMGLFRPLWLTR